MSLYKNQSGFGHIQLILILFVLIVVGGAGWLVFAHQDAKKTLPTQTQKSITNFDECVAAGNPVMLSFPEQCAANGKTFTKQTNTQQDETSNWLLYSPPGNEYSVRLADGWNLTRYEKTAGLSTFDNQDTVLKQGTKAVVTELSGGGDGQTGFFLNYATENIEQIVTPGKKQTSLKTNDGLEIEKFYWVVSGYSDEGLGVGNGDSQYTYVIRKSANKVIEVSYSFQPDEVDNAATVEKVLKTIHFN